jgi:hypothetical protein
MPASTLMAQTPTSTSVVAGLQTQLRAMRGADGGWPYYAGRASRIEPTCWAHIATSLITTSRITTSPITTSPITTSPITTSPHPELSSFLGSRRRGAAPWLIDLDGAPPNYAWNGLALFALRDPALRSTPVTGTADLASELETLLVSAKGIQLPPDPSTVKQDSLLQAWPWTDATFSWIEPTSWCVLALKRGARGGGVPARLTEAESLIVDRACESGGWNYGNSQVLLQDLRPYVPTTALALLAMQDQRRHAVVARSLAWLEAHAISEPSALALSLAAICLHVFDRPVTAVLDAIVTRYARTAFLQNAHLMAMALYALTMSAHGARAFRVA